MVPDTITDVMAALQATYATLNEEHVEMLAEALTSPGTPNKMAAAIGVLRDIPDLSNEGLIALAGCARMISSNGWTGDTLAGERIGPAVATSLIFERGGAIAALPQPELPALPVPEQITDLDAA